MEPVTIFDLAALLTHLRRTGNAALRLSIGHPAINIGHEYYVGEIIAADGNRTCVHYAERFDDLVELLLQRELSDSA